MLCVSLPGKHISVVICVPLPRKHISLVICGNGRFQKISIPYHGRLLGFPKGRGGSRLWNSEGMGGIYDWKSEGMGVMGEFHRWDFWRRKCRVSSLKTLYTVFTNGGHAGKNWCLVMKARRWRVSKNCR